MSFLKNKHPLKGANYLELIPKCLVEYEITENNLVTILFPRFNSSFAKKYFILKQKSPHIKVKLDNLGSAVWLAIDGKKKVSQIVDELAIQFGDQNQDLLLRLTKFLTRLYEQKFITFSSGI